MEGSQERRSFSALGHQELCSTATGWWWLGAPRARCLRAGAEGWEQAAALPKQCSSMQSLAGAFMIYLKFKSMPRPSGQGEGCQEPGWRRGGGRKAGLPLCASLALLPELCTLWRCRVWAPLGWVRLEVALDGSGLVSQKLECGA